MSHNPQANTPFSAPTQVIGADIHVILPPYLMPLDEGSGYFFNVDDEQLYSLKSGKLRKMKYQQANYTYNRPAGWFISVKGKRIHIGPKKLKTRATAFRLERRAGNVPLQQVEYDVNHNKKVR
ncbi:hypothetical protein CPT_Mendera_159 [Stenotrophomonas phage Mendera]|uniref:Uncharacterized protein n=1 Tax=Stenotrophomonas phage Mendera TaxID=2650877 RepID=A0A5P8PJ63_9CAUD|nr:hypothetical protein HWC60_gp256 [Stenotrophomonas phage Mendera]QFR56685.1 hypothetical protein CPT_Mendera_159 [Stenotrophomonas phage Mendera]